MKRSKGFLDAKRLIDVIAYLVVHLHGEPVQDWVRIINDSFAVFHVPLNAVDTGDSDSPIKIERPDGCWYVDTRINLPFYAYECMFDVLNEPGSHCFPITKAHAEHLERVKEVK